ncbi:conjugative transposon protein TraM [Pedobacter deserti]|uniref:conjugative transposon protein TraM n=1 Tax=Pedobacter deserti TaxID=2817382 RepID=UPI00210CC173|nr:conjugative transposon protein TraM [Pedobacter sp. SYSU D00382]
MNKKIETRRMLLFLPLVVIPLLALAFYALGGGSGNKDEGKLVAAGINTALPEARFGADSLADKMAVYDRAAVLDTAGLENIAGRLGFAGTFDDPQTRAIEERLSALQVELAKPEVVKSSGFDKRAVGGLASNDMSRDVDKLEMLMKSMQSPAGEDPELAQLSGLLQSIQEIQNPDLARLKFSAGVKADGELDSQFVAIPAEVDGDHRVVQGSVVRLRLLDTVRLGGQVFPKGHLVCGLAGFSNQRLNLEIKNIRLGNAIVPVNLTVFDRRDAMAGIAAPEAMLSDAASGGVVDAAGSVTLGGFDLGTQIVGAGIDAARSLLARKVKRIRQPVKSGYQVLLRDNARTAGN